MSSATFPSPFDAPTRKASMYSNMDNDWMDMDTSHKVLSLDKTVVEDICTIYIYPCVYVFGYKTTFKYDLVKSFS